MTYFLHCLEKSIDAYFANRPRRKPEALDTSKICLVAHRGAHNDLIPENTLEAFERALNLNCYGIEFDVHACADGVLVVHHDETLKRIWGHDVAIKTLRFEALRALVPDIPSLAEVIAQYGKKLHLYIELKSPFIATTALAETLNQLSPVIDYHILSLDETLFPTLSQFPKASMLLVPAHNNVDHFCKLSLKLHYGGVLSHYLLLRNRQIDALLNANQLVGVGFVDSKFSLYRELHRGLRLLFTNNAARVTNFVQTLVKSTPQDP